MNISATYQSKIGVLLINTGTPEAPSASAIRRYLRVFLMDRRMIELPKILRWLLVNLVIVPFRIQRVIKAYRSIWRLEGSPLWYYTEQFARKLQTALGSDYQVVIGMRYSEPNIQHAVTELIKNACKKIVVFPLYPQYSSAATASAIQETWRILGQLNNIPPTSVIPAFYNHPDFIAAYVKTIQTFLQGIDYDYLLFSYHGLPEQQVKKSEADSRVCDQKSPCPAMTDKNYYCYRAQCYETTRLLSKSLGLMDHQFGVSFQSRVGMNAWIKPYTDKIFAQLRCQGIQNLVIACPSFVADCLETLEEIKITAAKQWTDLGGHHLTVLPCLNDNDDWVVAAKHLIIASN